MGADSVLPSGLIKAEEAICSCSSSCSQLLPLPCEDASEDPASVSMDSLLRSLSSLPLGGPIFVDADRLTPGLAWPGLFCSKDLQVYNCHDHILSVPVHAQMLPMLLQVSPWFVTSFCKLSQL